MNAMDVSLASLWLPILVSSIIVFVSGFLLHMVVPHHRTDFSRLPDEDGMRDAARNLPRGEYVFPYASTPSEMKDPTYIEKANSGPVGLLFIGPRGVGPSGKTLGLHFIFVMVISLMAGYVASASLPVGTDYLKVFQIIGAAAWLGHAGAISLNSIWFFTSWSSSLKNILDGLVYALLTAGTFGWLWPGA